VRAIGIYEEGALAEYVKVPANNVHNIHNLPFEEATFIEPLAAAIQTFEMAPLQETDQNVVIIGAGKLGLLILQVVKNSGRKAIVVGRSHLDLAEKLGADITIRLDEDPINKIIEETKIGADVVIECTGIPESVDLAMALVRNRGTIDLKSTHGIRWATDLTQIVVRELKIQGSRCGPFPPAIQQLEEGSVHVADLVSSTFPLTQITEAIEAAFKPGNIKVVVFP
jgi:alcohol dehydrogenase